MAVATVGAIRNAYNTLTSGATSRQVIDMADEIDLIYPSATPFIVLLKKLSGSRKAHNWKFEWFTDEPFPHVDTLNGSTTAGATSLVVDNIAYWGVNDCGVDMANKGQFRVTTVTTGTSTLTVVWTETQTSGIADGTELLNCGSAFESGATYIAPRSTKEVADYNYLQIFRDSVGATEIQRLTRMYGGADWPYQIKKKMAEHKRKLERSVIWGERSYVTSGTNPYGTLRGLHQNISTNANTSFGAVTQAGLDGFLADCNEGDVARDSKYFFICGNDAKIYISELANTKERVRTGTTRYGINISTYETPALDHPLTIIVHPEFVGRSALKASGYVIAFHPDRMKHVHAEGNGINLNTHLRTSIQNPGYTSRVDEVYTCQSFELHREQEHGFLAGITAPA